MQTPRVSSLFRLGSALALVLVIAGCTKGGQFDPTEMFSSDVFDTKKKLSGEREPLFPNGVPGTTTGVPPDLVKGYQPPPDQADASATAAALRPRPRAAAEAQTEAETEAESRASAKPRPRRRRNKPDSAADQAAREAGRAAPAKMPPVQWPGPPQAAPAQQSAQPAQSIWPNPPPPANR